MQMEMLIYTSVGREMMINEGTLRLGESNDLPSGKVSYKRLNGNNINL